MKKLILMATMLLTFAYADAQTIQTSSRSTAGYIKSDGTIQNSSRSTIGYAKGIPKEWAAVTFFFFSL